MPRALLPRFAATPVAPAALIAFVSLGAPAPRHAPERPDAARLTRSEATPHVGLVGVGSLAPLACPDGTLPDGNVCVHLPGDDPGSADAESEVGAHHDRRGHWIVYDQLPRRPDRPADYDLYRYPVLCDHACVVSGYDLDLPDDRQRRGRRLSHVGHGAVDLPGKKGTSIVLVPLEHQQGDADVVFVGQLFGTTVITRHTLHEGGRLRDYLLVFGHLDAPAAGVRSGAHLAGGDLVGFVGDTGSPELVHLHLEARRVRDGVDVTKLAPEALAANENTVVCDPRNVLPLR